VKVFLDASVILAGLASEAGASRILLLLSETKKLSVAVSELVLEEVKRNIKKKFTEKELLSFASWLKKAKPQIITVNRREIESYNGIVISKDRHVLASTKKAEVKYLVTLDKKHLLKIDQEKAALSFKILTPGELITLLK
jgi:predicted nucleic acid-binding protein